MNKLSLVLLFLAFAFLHAQEEKGIHAKVELVTGTKQNAQFLGIIQDTVNLGGIIQGQFTVVKIHKDRFKSITDDQGNDLLHPESTTLDSTQTVSTDTTANPAIAVSDTSVQDSMTNKEPTQDTTAVDSTQEKKVPAASSVPKEFTQEYKPSFLDSVEGKHVFVALERRSIDSVLAEDLNNLSLRILREKGVPVVFTKRTNFGYCREQACIRDSLLTYGAASVYQGSITAARTNDSVTILMSHTPLTDSTDGKKAAIAQMNLPIFSAFSDAISGNKMKHFFMQLLGEKIPSNGPQKSYIHIDTDPEGANLEIEGKESICKTPCTFTTMDTGNVVLYAYWNVDRHIWAARSSVKPIPGDTNKVTLKLKQSKPELLITSIPEGAEIYPGSAPLTISTKSIGKTPNKYPIYEPGASTIQLRKEGYRDTTVTFYAIPTGISNVEVEMTPITDPAEQIKQQEWLHEKKKNFVGKTLMGSSIAPILLGALFTYLAYEDYDDADDIKKDLNLPATSGGENYKKLVKKNHDLVDKGDRKMIIGGSLLGTGILLLGVGFTLSF